MVLNPKTKFRFSFAKIPMFPVCMKDLTFIHLGNPTQDEGLVRYPIEIVHYEYFCVV